jgi:hypothetical protein
MRRFLVNSLAITTFAIASGITHAGAGSASSLGDGASSSSSTQSSGRQVEKINKHAMKSAVVLRQLLAQSGVPGIAPTSGQK